MRVLFTFAGKGTGHVNPLVPVARVVDAAGHTLAFAGHHSARGVLDASGFTLFSEPSDLSSGPPTITPLVELDMERESRVLRDFYADRSARARATRILDVSSGWQPDLLVCDETDFGSMIAAERLALPHATVLVTASGSFVRPDVVAEPLDRLRAEHGLPPDPDVTMLGRYLVLSSFPPSFRDPAHPLSPNAFSFRTDSLDQADTGVRPAWLSSQSDRPTVYLTLGTVFNLESGDLFTRVLSGLSELPITVIATVGIPIDPAVLGPQPDNVRIERYIPQAAFLPHCDLVVNHGGSGSVNGALEHGLPMVVIPMGADQPLNAARCEQLGVGVALDAMNATPRSIREAVSRVLETSTYRVAAERIRDEVHALPEAGEAVPLLERLVGLEQTSKLS